MLMHTVRDRSLTIVGLLEPGRTHAQAGLGNRSMMGTSTVMLLLAASSGPAPKPHSNKSELVNPCIDVRIATHFEFRNLTCLGRVHSGQEFY